MQQIPLSPRQQEFLAYLQETYTQKSCFPSLRQAAADLNISHTAVASLMQTLEEKGWITRGGRYSRNISFVKKQEDTGEMDQRGGRRVPIIGKVSAGLPLYAQQEWAGSLVVDEQLYRGTNLFALRIQGDSMRDVAILDGDLAICEPRQFAENGEIVVALIHNEEATVKRFFYRHDHIELQPENNQYKPMHYGLGEVLIQGRVIGIFRPPEQILKL